MHSIDVPYVPHLPKRDSSSRSQAEHEEIEQPKLKKVKSEVNPNGLAAAPQHKITDAIALQSRKGQESIAVHPKQANATAAAPQEAMPAQDSPSWWDWFWGNSVKAAAPAEKPLELVDAPKTDEQTLADLSREDEVMNEEVRDYYETVGEEILQNQDFTDEKNAAPDLLNQPKLTLGQQFERILANKDHYSTTSLKQQCTKILIDKSVELHRQFELKKNDWVSRNQEIIETKDLLKLLTKCKKPKGDLDLTAKDPKTVELVKRLKARQPKDAGELPKRYTDEEYTTLFNEIKAEQDDISFKNSIVMDELKEISQTRAELHQFMIAIAKAEHEAMVRIIQKIARL